MCKFRKKVNKQASTVYSGFQEFSELSINHFHAAGVLEKGSDWSCIFKTLVMAKAVALVKCLD